MRNHGTKYRIAGEAMLMYEAIDTFDSDVLFGGIRYPCLPVREHSNGVRRYVIIFNPKQWLWNNIYVVCGEPFPVCPGMGEFISSLCFDLYDSMLWQSVTAEEFLELNGRPWSAIPHAEIEINIEVSL